MSTDATIQTARAFVADVLEGVIPAEWKMTPTLEAAKRLDVPGVYLEYTRIERADDLPPGHARVVIYASVIDPNTDTAQGENAVDDEVVELVTAIDAHPLISWTEAEKLRLPTGELGWRITLNLIVSTTPTEE